MERKIAFLSSAPMRGQGPVSKALRAERTAASTSPASASLRTPFGSSLAGLMIGKSTPRVDAPTGSPSMMLVTRSRTSNATSFMAGEHKESAAANQSRRLLRLPI